MVSQGHVKFNRWLSFIGGGIVALIFLIINFVGFANGKVSLANLFFLVVFLYVCF